MSLKHRCAVVLLAVWLVPAAASRASTILVDFGSTNTTTDTLGRTWVNITSSSDVSGSPHTLTSTTNVDSGYRLTITNPTGVTNPVGFNGVNTNGAATLTGTALAHGYPSTATTDSLYGNDVVFSGNTVESVRLLLTNLQADEVYDLHFFASRTGASDNREGQYQVTGGNGTSTVYLNAANNTSNLASFTGITPDASQQITIDIAPGPNNTNSNGFFYVNVLEINSTPVPEPGTLAMLGMALCGVAAACFRRVARRSAL